LDEGTQELSRTPVRRAMGVSPSGQGDGAAQQNAPRCLDEAARGVVDRAGVTGEDRFG
jgi:chitodextrinase